MSGAGSAGGGSYVAPTMMVLGSVLSAAGKVNQGSAYAQQGQALQTQQNYEATLLQQQAGQDRAVAQQRQEGQLINMNLALSKARALSSYAGGTSTDPTVVNQVLGPLRAQGEYNAMNELYTGEEKARGEENQATLDRYMGAQYLTRGQSLQKASNISAASGLLSQGATLYSKYGDLFNGKSGAGAPQ